MVTYFLPEVGTQNKILDFYEDDYESAEAIAKKLCDCLKALKLPLSAVTSYSADNASVNYGKNKSVYQILTKENPAILKANCFLHVFHNAGKFAVKKIDQKYDIETLAN